MSGLSIAAGGLRVGLTNEQLAERRAYLGGTDMAALAGVNPPGWAKPIDVWLDKVGQAVPRAGNTMMSMGSLLEPVVADLFAEATGLTVRRPGGPVRDRREPWLGGHLDRWVGRDGLLECKWAMSRDEWGPTVTLEEALDGVEARVPPQYAVQVQHYLNVTGRRWGYLAVLLGYADFRWYALQPDQETHQLLRELARRFWHENVLAGVPPEPDGSDSYAQWLARRYAKDRGTEAVATPAQAVYWRQWLEANAQVTAAEQLREEAKQRLQDSMGEVAKLVLPDGGSVTWRHQERKDTDWAAVAAELAPKARLAKLAQAHTTTTVTRPWRPRPPKLEE